MKNDELDQLARRLHTLLNTVLVIMCLQVGASVLSLVFAILEG